MCGIKRFLNPEKKIDEVSQVIPIAGDLLGKGGKAFDWEAKRLKTSDSADDATKEGVRVTLKGGIFEGRTQRAVVEFRCNQSLTGLEGEWDSEDKYERGDPEADAKLFRRAAGLDARDDAKDGAPEGYAEKQLTKENTALVWERRASVDDVDTLYLTWHTKYACEKRDDSGDAPPAATPHWGIFTWLFIL